MLSTTQKKRENYAKLKQNLNFKTNQPGDEGDMTKSKASSKKKRHSSYVEDSSSLKFKGKVQNLGKLLLNLSKPKTIYKNFKFIETESVSDNSSDNNNEIPKKSNLDECNLIIPMK